MSNCNCADNQACVACARIKLHKLRMKLIAADRVMKEIDDMCLNGKLSSRSSIADRRLDYGQPLSYEYLPQETNDERN